jgi:integrase
MPGRKERFIRDDVVRGLGVRITAGGGKSFIFEARIKGRPRRLTLGNWPDLTVVLARQKAHEIRGRIARGEDPAGDAAQARNELSFGELTTIYLDQHARPHKRSAARDEYILNRLVPNWKNRRLSDISRDDVSHLHVRIGEAHGHYAANRMLAALKTMFNLARNEWRLFGRHDAVGWHPGENPAEGAKPFKEYKRERFLSPEELQRVNAALLEEPDWRWRTYFPLALMLGTRKSELLAMRWQHIDLNAHTWRIPETKTGNSHLLPLPAPATAMLEKLPSRDQSDWVFPGTGASGHLTEPKMAWSRIRKRAGVENARVHDCGIRSHRGW